VALIWVLLGILVLGGVAVVAAGRGQGLPASEPDRPDLTLPQDRLADRGDVDAVRFSVGLRGYRMDEVDDVLDRLASDLDSRDARIAALEDQLRRHTPAGDAKAEDAAFAVQDTQEWLADHAEAGQDRVEDGDGADGGRRGEGADPADGTEIEGSQGGWATPQDGSTEEEPPSADGPATGAQADGPGQDASGYRHEPAGGDEPGEDEPADSGELTVARTMIVPIAPADPRQPDGPAGG
jgi:DivIVA domain-containing protein